MMGSDTYSSVTTVDQTVRAEIESAFHAWGKYHQIFSPYNGPARTQPASLSFEQQGHATGMLSPSTVAALLAALAQTTFCRTLTSDYIPGYCRTLSDQQALDRSCQDQRFYHLKSEQLWAMWDLLDELESPVATILGQPWRLLQIKSWMTPWGASEYGMNSWHYDGLPGDIFKIMVYLTELGPGLGSVELMLAPGEATGLAGPAGIYLVFKNSVVYHRGVGPTIEGVNRIVVELTITRSATFDLQPRHVGYNSTHPLAPWLGREFAPLP